MSEDDDLDAAIERVAAAADPIGFHLVFAKSGDKAALYALIERYLRTVAKGQEIDPRLLEFITDRLERILDGEDPRAVFPKLRREGAPSKTIEHLELAVAVASRIIGKKAPRGYFGDQPRDYVEIDGEYWQRRCTDDEAIAAVIKQTGEKKSIVGSAFNRYRKAAYRRVIFERLHKHMPDRKAPRHSA